MPSSTTLANGQTLVSSSLKAKDMDALFQDAVCMCLGIVITPFPVAFNLSINNVLATTLSTQQLYSGMSVVGPGLPVFTDNVSSVIISQVLNPTTVILSSAAAATQVSTLTVSDNAAYWKVRVGWVTGSQPGFSVTDGVAFVTSEVIDSYQGSIRDNQVNGTTSTYTYTITWRIRFVFYGPSGFDNAAIVRSTMLLSYLHDFLAGFNLYLNPDTKAPRRSPEAFAGQWFDRTDLYLEFNEFVTETITVGTGTSVEVIVSTPRISVVKDFVVGH